MVFGVCFLMVTFVFLNGQAVGGNFTEPTVNTGQTLTLHNFSDHK